MVNALWAVSVLAGIVVVLFTPALAWTGRLKWAWRSVVVMIGWVFAWVAIGWPDWGEPDSASLWGIVVSMIVAGAGALVILAALLAIKLRRQWGKR